MKYYIEVELPVADIKYDLIVPDQMQVGVMIQLIASVFTKLSNGVYMASEDSTVCNQKTGESYDVNLRVYETNIRNGTKLYLF